MRVDCRCGFAMASGSPGKPGARAHIGDAFAGEIGVRGQAVEQVRDHHRLVIFDGGEIVGAVPLPELTEQPQ